MKIFYNNSWSIVPKGAPEGTTSTTPALTPNKSFGIKPATTLKGAFGEINQKEPL